MSRSNVKTSQVILSDPKPKNIKGANFDGKLPDVTAVILAGGKASRMGGINKALLKIKGKTIIEREIAILDSLFPEIIIITNSPEDYKFLGKPTFRDIIPGKGSLGGLYTGLMSAKNPYSFFVACDMPFLNSDIIKVLVENIKRHDIVIPKINGHFEPIHAIYSKRCLPFIKKLVLSDSLKILSVLDQVDVLEIPVNEIIQMDPDLDFIMNVNTPEDLKKATAKTVSDEMK
ncbi:MAG: molybdenum cofactor guanylyltransferase [Syntrophaceae bacterium]|nr:molybdenum cofactor guanylyltransferase [Syntrophaceae bacterium]